ARSRRPTATPCRTVGFSLDGQSTADLHETRCIAAACTGGVEITAKPFLTARHLAPDGVPNGIRTRVTNVKGWCPRPLDDGDEANGQERRELPLAASGVTSKPAGGG